MKFSEIAPPGREKQVKKLKKKFDDPGAPYAIAWAQHNKHGKPNKNEGRMSDIDADIKTLSDQEFQKKYSKSKEQMKKDLNESTEYNTIKAILIKHNIKSTDDIEYGSEVYDELFGYYMNSGEMPYGIMKAREGDPDVWIADRIDDLGLLEDGSSQTSMNKYGLSARNHKGKFYSYKNGKMTGVFDSIEELARHQEELIKDESVDEAPFGAIKKAVNKAKKVVGKVPGLGDMKTKADAEANIGQVANDVWKSYLQFKQSDPDAAQVKGWFKTNHGMDVEPDANANVDQDAITPGIKQAMAAKQSRTKATPDASPEDAKDIKVKLDLLKKTDPNANATTMVAIKKLASGNNIDPTRQQALQPLLLKVAKALNNPGKANLLSRALAESLSQQDLSKLDMLARQGMVPKNKVSRFKTAMRTLANGKDLPISYKDDVIDVVMKLSKIITKPSVMGMVRKGLKEQTDPQTMFNNWVKQSQTKHNI
jgi:hypothetical protein